MTALHSVFAGGVILALISANLPGQEKASSELAHVRTEFSFTVNASMVQAAPLFGADKERVWAPDWNPRFLYPSPAQDRQGMVFQVAHGPYTSTWINTALDVAGGHIQYAYVLNDAMATTIDIRLKQSGTAKTDVMVVYERTALIPEANEHVQHFAAGDAKAGSEWEAQIEDYLAKQAAHK